VALGIFDIRNYGAVGDGKAVDSPAINKAIEAAAAAGGGTVLFPPGIWLSFSIRLKSHVALYLSQGATILAADSPLPNATTGYNGGTYDAAEPNTAWDAYQDYGHNHWHNSLIWGEGINDVSITGPGLIFGKGLSFGAGPGRPANALRSPLTAAPPALRPPRGNYTMFQAEQPGVGNKAIALKNCRNVLFRDFSILKGGRFGLLSPASTTSPSTTSPSTPTATEWTSTVAATSASPTASSTLPGTTPSAPSPVMLSATTGPPRT
jgi:polygalacturonase